MSNLDAFFNYLWGFFFLNFVRLDSDPDLHLNSCWIRIRIEKNRWIRIHNKWMWIHSPGHKFIKSSKILNEVKNHVLKWAMMSICVSMSYFLLQNFISENFRIFRNCRITLVCENQRLLFSMHYAAVLKQWLLIFLVEEVLRNI